MPTGDFKQGTNLDSIHISGQISGTSSTAIHTVGGHTEKIATVSLTNITALPVIINVALVPSGSTDDGTHTILSSFSLNANDTITQEDWLAALKGVSLPAGSFIAVTQATAASVNYQVTGVVSS